MDERYIYLQGRLSTKSTIHVGKYSTHGSYWETWKEQNDGLVDGMYRNV